MELTMLKGKIHRAVVKQAELNYVGSITIDPELMDAAGILEYEMVQIVDVENDSLMVELTGNGSKVDAFLELLEGYEILELARTGITGLQRGIKDVTVIDQEGNINTL